MRRIKAAATGISIAWLTLSILACMTDAPDGECEVGSEGCECTAGDGCDPGLQCVMDVCQEPCDGGSCARDAGTRRDSGRPSSGTCTGTVDACWQGCISSGTTTAACRASCDLGDAYGCYALCVDNGDDAGTCRSLCGASGAIAELGCAETCAARGVATATCKSLCGLTSDCGEVGCAGVCLRQGDDVVSCKNVCGFTTARGREACHAVCSERGESPATCSAICG
ncbi:hypothetical protein [Sandaracinus amylolyticus]|uniref:hypothetical protein n=1 Tax=Sandaracinus amylolyticus TaxID=927083 RepID=UPI001F3D6C85|nr:hypothetical protein [Sandaracinus amylolyticus]UJR85148.1 Hypothetical protein I5071_72280 [Sandaracinus amylolyticus]